MAATSNGDDRPSQQQQQQQQVQRKDPPKGSLMKGGSLLDEGFFGILCGLAYGVTSPLVGQPFDTVKTKMQAQKEYSKGGMLSTFVKVVRTEGFFALYKGILPPLFGSTIFRAVQFGTYSAAYTWMRDSPWLCKEIPLTGGLEVRVVAAGVFASTIRSLIESPLELIKVRRQVGQPWKLTQLYTGFNITWVRTVGLMTTFFVLVDSLVRHAPDLVNAPLIGPFLKGSVCATISWWVVWPFEMLKSQVQGQSEGPKGSMARLLLIARTGGVAALFRGIVPGSCRSLLANGASMLVYSECQDLRTRWEDSHKIQHPPHSTEDIKPSSSNL